MSNCFTQIFKHYKNRPKHFPIHLWPSPAQQVIERKNIFLLYLTYKEKEATEKKKKKKNQKKDTEIRINSTINTSIFIGKHQIICKACVNKY